MLAAERSLLPQLRELVARLGHTYGHRLEPLCLGQQSGGHMVLHLACKTCDRTLHHELKSDSDKGTALFEPCQAK